MRLISLTLLSKQLKSFFFFFLEHGRQADGEDHMMQTTVRQAVNKSRANGFHLMSTDYVQSTLNSEFDKCIISPQDHPTRIFRHFSVETKGEG